MNPSEKLMDSSDMFNMPDTPLIGKGTPPLYSVLMPTYNERENLPIMVYLIMEMAKKKYDFDMSHILTISQP